MREVIPDGATVVDAGTYKGGYTFWMREEVGPQGQVFAFEPQPELADFVGRSRPSVGRTSSSTVVDSRPRRERGRSMPPWGDRTSRLPLLSSGAMDEVMTSES
jgi:predicted methyltransferase